MATPANPKREEVTEDLKTKTVYSFFNDDAKFNVKSREVYKKRKRTVHFPFNNRTGKPKYSRPLKITFESLDKIPAGFLKAPSTGLGFTRDLFPLFDQIKRAIPKLKHIIVTGERVKSSATSTVATINITDINEIRLIIKSALNRQGKELAVIANNKLAHIIPSKFKSIKADYTPGQLLEFVNQNNVRSNLLSDRDINSILGLIESLPKDHPFAENQNVLPTKTSFDLLYVESLVKAYKRLLNKKTASTSLEAGWQKFFSKHLLYFNFGYVDKFEKHLIFGDVVVNIPDFILLNSFSYIDVFEIKTHLTSLLSFDRGRKNFYWSAEAAKAISQAENYLYSMHTHSETIINNLRKRYGVQSIEIVRPSVYIIASTKKNLAGADTMTKYRGGLAVKLQNDFRRLNNSLKDIKFILYDELLLVFETTVKKLGERSSRDKS